MAQKEPMSGRLHVFYWKQNLYLKFSRSRLWILRLQGVHYIAKRGLKLRCLLFLA